MMEQEQRNFLEEILNKMVAITNKRIEINEKKRSTIYKEIELSDEKIELYKLWIDFIKSTPENEWTPLFSKILYIIDTSTPEEDSGDFRSLTGDN